MITTAPTLEAGPGAPPVIPGRTPKPATPGRAVRFPQGLPGFPHLRRFRLEPLPGAGPFLVLAASDDPELRFVVLAGAAGLLAAVDVAMAAEAALGAAADEVRVLLVVSLQGPPGERRAFVNLRAPILLDETRGLAAQHVLANPCYPVRHPLPVIREPFDP
jgi:flagellar assembly factor FliW